MKILHVSDTHLGYSAYRKTTEDGVNQREMDVYNAFEQFVDYAVKIKPDIIIHAGDLFDSVRPNNRAITFSIKQILRLSKKNIPVVIISGNHDQPKLRETAHIFEIFDHIENVFAVYRARYETLDFELEEYKLTVHAVPQCNSKKEFEEELKKVKPNKNSDYNILVAHGAVSGIVSYSMNEFNEMIIPRNLINKDFDYIALGHYHKYSKIDGNAFYPGSTENFTFSDIDRTKGFIDLEFSDKKLNQKFVEIKVRPMIDAKPIKCSNLSAEEIMSIIKQTINEIEPDGKAFRIVLEEIPSSTYRLLDFEEIKRLSSKAIHYEIKPNVIKEDNLETTTTSRIDTLINEFKAFLENYDVKEKEKILELASKYIERIESRNEEI